MRIRNQKRKKLISYLLIGLLALSLGYALLTTTLNITGLANVNSLKWDIRWINSRVTEGSVTDELPTIDSRGTSATYAVNLKFPGDFYEFIIDVKNNGGRDAMISTIENKIYEEDGETELELPEYIHYSFTYTNGTTVAAKQKIAAGEKKQYKVRLEYDANTEESPEEDIKGVAKIKVNYVQADNTAVVINDGRINIAGHRTVAINDPNNIEEPQLFYVVSETNIDGTDCYVLFAHNNLSIFATTPGSVLYSQYDENKAAKKYGVDKLEFSEMYDYIPIKYKYDEVSFSYYDYEYDLEWPQYVYNTIDVTEHSEYLYDGDDGQCYWHNELDTGVPYCFTRYVKSNCESNEEACFRKSNEDSIFSRKSKYLNGYAEGIGYYVEEYKSKMESWGKTILEARLLSYEEALEMGDDLTINNGCFWLGSAADSSDVYYSCNEFEGDHLDSKYSTSSTADVDGYEVAIGVRPVLVIPKSEFE